MRVLDIRFVKERDSKRLQAQAETMEKLRRVLPQRFEEKFDDVEVRVRFSSSSGFDVSGFRKEDKDDFLAYLEALWDDPFLLD